MKVAIVGSRKYTNLRKVQTYIATLPKDTVVISGGAVGVDRIAEAAAKRLGLQVIVYPAEWDKHGIMAGKIRNSLIVEECDRLVAFWDKKSNGTKDSIDKARKAGKPFEVITP